MSSGKPLATLSIDLDDLWCYQRSFGLDEWQDYPSFLSIALPRLVELLGQHNLKITAFVIGRDAEKKKLQPLFKQFSAAGHEIGNHSFDHSINLHRLSKEQIRDDLERADKAIRMATGKKPVGFRGPAYGLSNALLEALADLGYQYDSSTLPSSVGVMARQYHRAQANSLNVKVDLNESLYGNIKESFRPIHPYQWMLNSGSMIELPISTMPLLRLPFHGTYLHYLADRSKMLAYYYYLFSVLLCKKLSVTPSFLLHATDFIGGDDGDNLFFIPGMKRKWKEKELFTDKVLTHYSNHFKVVPLNAYLDSLSLKQLKQYQPTFS